MGMLHGVGGGHHLMGADNREVGQASRSGAGWEVHGWGLHKLIANGCRKVLPTAGDWPRPQRPAQRSNKPACLDFGHLGRQVGQLLLQAVPHARKARGTAGQDHIAVQVLAHVHVAPWGLLKGEADRVRWWWEGQGPRVRGRVHV